MLSFAEKCHEQTTCLTELPSPQWGRKHNQETQLSKCLKHCHSASNH